MIHTISATRNYRDEHYAMCGWNLGSYSEATAHGHVVGNYAQPSYIREHVTCPDCLARV